MQQSTFSFQVRKIWHNSKYGKIYSTLIPFNSEHYEKYFSVLCDAIDAVIHHSDLVYFEHKYQINQFKFDKILEYLFKNFSI